jgi:hypothetical protein
MSFLIISLQFEELSLRPGTVRYKTWTDPPLSWYFRVYLFTSQIRTMSFGTRPTGPRRDGSLHVHVSGHVINFTVLDYSHLPFRSLDRQKHTRVNIETFDNGRMKFMTRRTWHFMPRFTTNRLDIFRGFRLI